MSDLANMSSVLSRKVGYWWSEKKSRKLNLQELSEVFRKSGLELVKIDLDAPLEDQGPFCAIVHKLSDMIMKAQQGNEHSMILYSAFQKYISAHPRMAIIDSFPNIEALLDRYRQYKLVAESELCSKGDIFIPAFVELTTTNSADNLSKMREVGIDFPIVCKPSMAHGYVSHQLSLIFNEEGLKDISPPCVVQKFINHNAICYKIFAIGDKYFVIERPSLKNFYAGDHKTIFFDSNDISKPHSASALTALDEYELGSPIIPPEKSKMDRILKVVHNLTGLALLGIDIIIDNSSGSYAIIDMNIFPGYWEIDSFYSLLSELVLQKVLLKESDKEEGDFTPILVNSLSKSPFRKKCGSTFKFEADKIEWYTKHMNGSMNYTNSCLCCPISSSCCNTVTSLNDATQNLLQKQNIICDDSGVETSDSYEEKTDNKAKQSKNLKVSHSKSSLSSR